MPEVAGELALLRAEHDALSAWLATKPESVEYPGPYDEEALIELLKAWREVRAAQQEAVQAVNVLELRRGDKILSRWITSDDEDMTTHPRHLGRLLDGLGPSADLIGVHWTFNGRSVRG